MHVIVHAHFINVGVSYYQGLVQDALFYNQSLTQRYING